MHGNIIVINFIIRGHIRIKDFGLDDRLMSLYDDNSRFRIADVKHNPPLIRKMCISPWIQEDSN